MPGAPGAVAGTCSAGGKLCSIAIAVMAKAPRPGQVKTRLVPPLTPEAAAALYRCFLLDTLDAVRRVQGATPAVAYAPADARPTFEALAGGLLLVPQEGTDLTGRLLSTFDRLFALRFEGVIAMGSDTPSLPVRYLDEAVSRLGSGDVDLVLGPSDDGGYYLIGLRRREPALFEGMTWSVDTVLAETRRRASSLGLREAILPGWFDVDTPADLERLRGTLTGPRGRHTGLFLARGPV